MEKIEADICMVINNDMTRDGRVLKEAKSLADSGWRVAVIAHYLIQKPDDLPPYEQIHGFELYRYPIKSGWFQQRTHWFERRLLYRNGVLRAFRIYDTFCKVVPEQFAHWWFHRTNMIWTRRYRQISSLLSRVNARVFHVHDYPNLLMISLAKIQDPVIVYDSHELYFDQGDNFTGFEKRRHRFLMELERLHEKRLMKLCKSVIVVSDSIADHMADKLSIKRPIVLRNAVDLRLLNDTPVLDFPHTQGRMLVHSGGIVPGRCLCEIVKSLVFLPSDIKLILLGSGDLEEQLQALSRKQGTPDRLLILPPVNPTSVASTISQAHIGMVLTDPTVSLNSQYALPNKLFESIAAGLPIISSLGEEISNLTQEYDIGISVDGRNPKAIADGIMQVLHEDNYQRYRHNALDARRMLNWENEEKRLIQLYERLLSEDPN